MTPLMKALQLKNIELAEFLVTFEELDINEKTEDWENEMDSYWTPPLIYCIESINIEGIKFLLKQPNVDYKSEANYDEYEEPTTLIDAILDTNDKEILTLFQDNPNLEQDELNQIQDKLSNIS
eukprot:TRINITY_DN4203_c0_g1_i1.p1 TRINITY_DN4203_c0_g1~~TRINITY_DN4203_c0_g1_i1.p1  ORF type:complete len:123 (+),score=37.58 TRINITY_DN4203_c0_g1_i1:365-733(+)